MPKKRSLLLVLSHIGSDASALARVLGLHPEIDGQGESHLRYRFGLDFQRLKWRVREQTGQPLNGRYVLDTMLHNYRLSGALISSPDTRAIFFLRDPEQTLPGIAAAPDYVRRLRRLTQLAPLFGKRAALVESEWLAARTFETLRFIERFLELQSPLGAESPPLTQERATQVQSVTPAIAATAAEAHAECVRMCRLHCLSLAESTEREIARVRLEPDAAKDEEIMQILVNSDHNISSGEAVTARVESIVADSASRFADRITRIEVHLSDENADKHGERDKRCMIEARLGGLKPIAVTNTAPALVEAIEGAADKLERALEHAIGRLSDRQKDAGRPPVAEEG